MLYIIFDHCDNVETTSKICLMLLGCKVKMERRRHISDHVCQFAKKCKDGELVLSLQKLPMLASYLNYLIEWSNRETIGVILCAFHSLYVVSHIVILNSSGKLPYTFSQILLFLNLLSFLSFYIKCDCWFWVGSNVLVRVTVGRSSISYWNIVL